MANWIARVLDRTLNDNYVQVRQRTKSTMTLNQLPNKPDKQSLLNCIPDNFDFSYIRMHKEGIIVTPHGILSCLYPEEGRDDLYFHQTVENDRPANQQVLTTTSLSKQFGFTKQESERPYHQHLRELGVELGEQFYFDDIDRESKYHPYGVFCLRLNRKRLSSFGKNRLLTSISLNHPDDVITLYRDGNSLNEYGEEVGELLDIASYEGPQSGTLRYIGLNPITLEFSKQWYELTNNHNKLTVNLAFGMTLESDQVAVFKGTGWPEDLPRPPYTDKAIAFFKEELTRKIQEAGISNTADRWRYFFTEEVGENGELKYRLIPDRLPLKTKAEWEAWEAEQEKNNRPFVYVGLRFSNVGDNTYMRSDSKKGPRYIHIPMFELKNDYARSTPGVKFFPCISASITSLMPAEYSFAEQTDVTDGTYRHSTSLNNLNKVFKGDSLPGDKYGLSAWFREELKKKTPQINEFINLLGTYVNGASGKYKPSPDTELYWSYNKRLGFDLSNVEVIYCRTYDEFQSYFFDIADNPSLSASEHHECFRINGDPEELKRQFQPYVDLPDLDSLYRFIDILSIGYKAIPVYRGMSAVSNDSATSVTYNGNTYQKNIRPRTEYGFSEVICRSNREGFILSKEFHDLAWNVIKNKLKIKQNGLKSSLDDPTAIHGIRQDDPWTKFIPSLNVFFTGFTDDDNHIGYINNNLTSRNHLRNHVLLDWIVNQKILFLPNHLPMNIGNENDYINDFYYIMISQESFQDCVRVFKENVSPGTIVYTYGPNRELCIPMYRNVFAPIPTNYDRNRPDMQYSIRGAWQVYQSIYEDDKIDPKAYPWLFEHVGLNAERNDLILHRWNSKVDFDINGNRLPRDDLFTELTPEKEPWGIYLNKNNVSSSTAVAFDQNFIVEYEKLMLKYGVAVITNKSNTSPKYILSRSRYSGLADVFLFVRMVDRFINQFVHYDSPDKGYILDRYIDAGIITAEIKRKALADKAMFDKLNIPAHMVQWAKDYIRAADPTTNPTQSAYLTTWLYKDTNEVRPHTVDEIFREMYDAYHYTMARRERTIQDTLGNFRTYVDWLRLNRKRINANVSEYMIDWTKFKVKNPLFVSEIESPNVNVVCNYTAVESVRRLMVKGASPGAWIFANMSYDMENEDWTTNGITQTNIPSYASGAGPSAEATSFCMTSASVFHRNDAAKIFMWMNNLNLAKNNVLEGGEIIHAQYFAHYCAPMLTNSNSEYYLFPYVADFFPVNPPREVVDEFFMNHVYNNGIEAFYRRYPPTREGTERLIEFLRGLKDKAYQIVMKHYEDIRIGSSSLHDLMKQRPYNGYNHLTFWYTALDYVHFDMIVNRVVNYAKKIEKPFIQTAWMDNMKEIFVPEANDAENTKLVEKITGNQLIGYFWLAIESIEHACSPYSDKNLTAAQRSIAHRKITRVAEHPANIPLTTSNPYIASRQHLYRVMPRVFLNNVYVDGSTDKDGRLFFSYETSAFYSCDSWTSNTGDIGITTFSSWLLNNYDRAIGKREGTTEARVHHYFGNSNNHVRIGIISDTEGNRIKDNYPSVDNRLFQYGGSVLNGSRYRTGKHLPDGYSAIYAAPKRPLYIDRDYPYTQDTPSKTYYKVPYASYSRDNVMLGLIFDPKTTIFSIVSDQTTMNEFIADLAEVSPLSYLKHLGLKPKAQMDTRTYLWIQERIYGVSAVIGDRYPRFLSPVMYKYYQEVMKTMVTNIPSNQLSVVQRFINGLRDIRHYRVLMFLLSIIPYHQIDNPEFLMTAIDETVDLDKLDSAVFFEESYLFEHVNRAIKYLRAHFNGGGEDNIIRNESLLEIVRGNNIVRFDRTVFRKGGSSNITKDAVTRDSVKATNVRGIRLFSPRITNENEITKLIITTFPTNSVVREMRVGNVNFGSIRMRDKLSHSSWYIVVSDRPSTLIAPSGVRPSNSKLVSIMKIGGSPTLTDSYALQGTWLRYDQTSINLRQFHDDYVINPAIDNVPDNILPENAVAYYAVSPAGKYLDFPNGHEYQTIIEEDGKPVIARFRTLDDGPTDVANCFIIVAVNE